MKKIIPLLIIFWSCTKEYSKENKPRQCGTITGYSNTSAIVKFSDHEEYIKRDSTTIIGSTYCR